MSTIDELRNTRLKKLESVKKAFLNPYPSEARRTHLISEALSQFSSLSKLKKEVIIDGRIRSQRGHGGSIFFDVEDGSGKMQAFLKKDRVGEKSYDFFQDNFDVGDFIEVRGILFKTKKGEKTIEVADYRMLAKSLLPLPEKWHGLQDTEERFRKRYLDMLFNPEVKLRFVARSKLLKYIREFLDKECFIEVETPTLQPLYGGAKAKPFKTHLNAFDIDLFLRIAPELYLKRLLVGGFERVYEIGKCFRNEGVDRSHNPDFTILEFYWAYADYKQLMKLTERMFTYLIKSLNGKAEIEYEGKKISFKAPFDRIGFSELLRKEAKINLEEINLEALKKEAQKLNIKIEQGAGKPEIADEIYKKLCLPKILKPTFVTNHPSGAFPLAKQLEGEEGKAANFQLVVAGGWELVNAYSELNDPLLQRRRFEEQEKNFRGGFQEAQRMDEDFIEALEYGMPPAAGFGMGIDRLAALLTNAHSLREVILFPTMKPKDN